MKNYKETLSEVLDKFLKKLSNCLKFKKEYIMDNFETISTEF